MEDEFLNALKQQPDEAFAQKLYTQVAKLPGDTPLRQWYWWLWPAALATVAALALVLGLPRLSLQPQGTPSHNATNYAVSQESARSALPISFTQIPVWMPSGFALSETVMVNALVTATELTHVDWFWQDKAGRAITLAMQLVDNDRASPAIVETIHSHPITINGSTATMADISADSSAVSLVWQRANIRYSLIAPRTIISSTLIKIAESTPYGG